ncbi:MAG: VWA domain-containing protein, partial [Acidobacteria bacterium]|nr:VWA domain-containing protein [Acidobacteriota bacterium]
MPIALQEPLWLLAALPIAVLLWSQRSDWPDRQRRRLLWMRGSLLALIVLALVEPVLTWRSRELDVAVLVDVSASVEPASLNRALQAVERGFEPESPVRLFAFADRAAAADGAADLRRLEVADSSTASAGAAALDRGNTDPGAALRQAVATLRPDRVRRVLLLSDGQNLD